MILSALGKVEFTNPDYNIKGHGKDEIDETVLSILEADLVCIMDALIIRYGIEKTLEVWTEVAEVVVKENTND